MKLRAADIIHAYCFFISDYKFLICICPDFPYFFFINSEPRRKTPDAQIKITNKDFPFLIHDSYIDTSTVCTIYPDEINKATFKDTVPNHIKTEIIKVVQECRYLSPNQKVLIKTNFSM